MWNTLIDHLCEARSQILSEPALWLCLTLLVYAFGMWIYKKSGYKTVFTPLLVAIVVLAAILLITGTPYKTFMEGGQHINFLPNCGCRLPAAWQRAERSPSHRPCSLPAPSGPLLKR